MVQSRKFCKKQEYTEPPPDNFRAVIPGTPGEEDAETGGGGRADGAQCTIFTNNLVLESVSTVSGVALCYEEVWPSELVIRVICISHRK